MYLNVVQLAESFGVEERVVEGWVREESLPFIADRGRMLFDRRQVVEWAAARGLAAKAGFLAPAQSTTGSGHHLETLLRTGGIWRDVVASEVLNVLQKVVIGLPGATPPIRQLLVQRLRSPNGVTWAPVGGGLAMPHLRVPVALGREAGTFALLFLRDPLPLVDPPSDDVPVTRLMFFIAPSPRAHLDFLARLSASLTRGGLKRLLQEGASDESLFAGLEAAEAIASPSQRNEDKP